MKQNITVAIDRDLIRKAKVLAAKRATSISRLLSDELAGIVNRQEEYEQARNKALAEMETGYHLGGLPASRDELHER